MGFILLGSHVIRVRKITLDFCELDRMLSVVVYLQGCFGKPTFLCIVVLCMYSTASMLLVFQKFDLKGSMRNRLVNTAGKQAEEELVLLDENLLKCKSSTLRLFWKKKKD